MRDKIIASVAKQINLYGVKRFTIDDIVRDLGISKKTVYKYFKSKDELVSEFLCSSIDGNIKRTLEAVEAEENLTDKIGAALISYHIYQIPIELLDDIQKYYSDDWQKIEEQRSFKLQLVKDLIREGIKTGKIRSNINIEILSMILDKTTRAIFEYSFLRDNNLNINSAVKEIENILLYGVLPK